MRQGQGERMKKSQEKHVTVVYTISHFARVPPTIFCCEKSLLFPPENLKTLIKVYGFPIFFRLFSPCYIGIYCADACPVPRGKRISTPAINLLNENPSLVALGKLTHTNPRATHEPTSPRPHEPAQPSLAQPSRTARSMGNLYRGSPTGGQRVRHLGPGR